MARIASHLSSGNSPMDATCWMPALLTGMSTAPSSAAVCSTISRTSAGFDRSAPEYATLVPSVNELLASNLGRGLGARHADAARVS